MAPPDVVDVDLLESRRDYVDALGRGDRRRATEVAFDLLYRGVPADVVLTDLVGAGQVEVGLAWQEGRWDVAQEHRASAVADAVIQAVAQQAWPTATAPPGVSVVGSPWRVWRASGTSFPDGWSARS